MSRLYLTLWLLLPGSFSFAQNELQRYLDFADEQYRKGDYIYALDYYEKAMEIDSNTVDILWKYAEALRAYKDYPKAAYYYKKVYRKEDAVIFPYSLLQWALMEKQQGNYAEAIELFKSAKKKYAKNKKSYEYLKSKRELESCLWAQSNVRSTEELDAVKLPEGLNTVNSEFGHLVVDSSMLFSSLRADSVGGSQEIYDTRYSNQLYTHPLGENGKARRIEALAESGLNAGNGTFSLDGNRFYFSLCTAAGPSYNCQIAVSSYSNGKWGKPELLGDVINEAGSNTTMPHIAQLEKDEVLFFSSNRKGGDGGLDIYVSVLKNNGNQFGKAKPVNRVNTPDDDLSPYYDEAEKRLYFSSSWWDGFGGYDVFFSPLKNGQFDAPVNAGQPVNSPANDVYFFRYGDSSFVSSNRPGVLYAKNPTCCSDIFAYAKPAVEKPVSKKETLEDLNKRLPVTLYFHNDVPDPRSKLGTTNVNYEDSYVDYIAMIPEYGKEYSKGLSGQKAVEAGEDIEDFFAQYVQQGMRDLELFRELLLEELEKGYRIRLNVRGFASPLAKTEYNVALTQRRIASLENHLKVVRGGAFTAYLNGTAPNGGRLEIVGIPFGEYTASKITSDNPNDLKNAIYSRAAAIERKIEIQSVSYIDADSLFMLLELSPTTLLFGKVSGPQTKELSIFNSGSRDLQIQQVSISETGFSEEHESVIPAGKSATVKITTTGDVPKGLFSIPVEIVVKDFEKPLRVMVLGEGQ